MLPGMAPRPLVLALANPTPEICPRRPGPSRPDAIIATGRSDYPNQVNNVLCFPFIFRGALDWGATTINERDEDRLRRGAGRARAGRAARGVAAAYAGETLIFGPEYLIPKPFEPRLMVRIAPAVATAAESRRGAARPIADMGLPRQAADLVYARGVDAADLRPRQAARRSGSPSPRARKSGSCAPCRSCVDENLARPTLIGRPEVVEQRIAKLRPPPRAERDYDLVNPRTTSATATTWPIYLDRMRRARA